VGEKAHSKSSQARFNIPPNTSIDHIGVGEADFKSMQKEVLHHWHNLRVINCVCVEDIDTALLLTLKFVCPLLLSENTRDRTETLTVCRMVSVRD